jgi:hypothetical protein
MLEFAGRVGMRVQIRPKESRERLAKRIADLARSLSDKERAALMAELLAKTSSQTEGWLDVIRGHQR